MSFLFENSVPPIDKLLPPRRSNISEIIPGKLYLGNMAVGCGKKTLRKYGIDVVLNVMRKKCSKLEAVKYYHVPIDEDVDGPNIDSFFDKTNHILHTHLTRKEKVFVHCVAGQHRSVAVVTAYLMFSQNWSFLKAFGWVKRLRPEASPKFRFALLRYEQRLKGMQKERMQRYEDRIQLERTSEWE
jgi:hypothetical protein